MQILFDKERYIYAGFFSRFAAFVLDSIIVAIGLCFVKLPFLLIKLAAGDIFLFKPFLFQFTIVDVICYLLTVTYFVLMTYHCGSTIGKFLMKIQVVDTEGQKMSFTSVLIRETVGKYLSELIVFIGYILIGFDSRKQGLHDKIADTCVVYKHGLCKVQEVKTVEVAEAVAAREVEEA